MQEQEKSVSEEKKSSLRLDFSLQSPEKRTELVHTIVENTPQEKLTSKYLEILADYIIFAMDKKERKERKITTENRMVTVNKREVSFEGLVSKFENGEDGIYNMIINDKNVLLTPKYQITQEDIDTIPELRQLRDTIEKIEIAEKAAKGKRKYLLKKQLIEMRQDQYIIKNAYKPAIYSLNLVRSLPLLDLSDYYEVKENGDIINKGIISLTNPTHLSILLCNYVKIKEDCWNKLNSDIYYLIQDLEALIDAVLKEDYPMYFDILTYKIDGIQNLEIQKLLKEKYNLTYTVEYISSLWRKKIPKLLAEYEEKELLKWYYQEVEKGRYKKCSKCGQIKLAHNKFFSKNNTSRDGYYSICKQCRNAKTKIRR